MARESEKTFPGGVRGTADPSTALRSGRDDKGERVISILRQLVDGADRRSLGFARDDKGKGDASIQIRCYG